MTFKELKSQIDKLDQKQLNQEVYIRFIDNKLNFHTIHLVTVEHRNKEKPKINWAWLFAELLSNKQKHQLKNQEDFIVKPI
jgi:transcriptional antiterminator